MPEKSKVCVEFIPLQDACSVDSLAGIFTDFTAFEHWRGEHLHAGHKAGLVCLWARPDGSGVWHDRVCLQLSVCHCEGSSVLARAPAMLSDCMFVFRPCVCRVAVVFTSSRVGLSASELMSSLFQSS